MSKYQITLTPVDKFFFGGDMTFQVGTDETDAHNSQFKSYIIQSSMFPQQTSLLGMLRFLILRNNGDSFKDGHIVNTKTAETIIGPHSFIVNGSEHQPTIFGLIQGLSHVYVLKTVDGNKTRLEFAPLFGALDLNGSSKGIYNQKEICIPIRLEKEYVAKDGLPYTLTDGVHPVKFEDIFIKDRRIGIDRNIDTGKVDDAALFKQISYRFNNKAAQYQFAFEAKIADELDLTAYNGQLVTVGADNSQFIIGISKNHVSEDTIKPINNAVYLLSPTFLPRKDAQTAKFAITRLMPFRFLQSVIMGDAKSYHILSGELTRSKRYELYAPGSVFYFENEEQKKAFVERIDAQKDFKQIGYNEYK